MSSQHQQPLITEEIELKLRLPSRQALQDLETKLRDLSLPASSSTPYKCAIQTDIVFDGPGRPLWETLSVFRLRRVQVLKERIHLDSMNDGDHIDSDISEEGNDRYPTIYKATIKTGSVIVDGVMSATEVSDLETRVPTTLEPSFCS
jgi:adenylate cyclase class IV